MADPIIHPIVTDVIVRPTAVQPTISQSGLTGPQGPTGPTGPTAIHVGPTPPADTSLIWVDTTV